MHVAAAVIPGTHGRPSDLEQASVVVTRVTAISSVGTVELDADLLAVPVHLDEARLIGRVSRRRSRTFPFSSATLSLPEDLSVGDLIAVPCCGAVRCRELKVR